MLDPRIIIPSEYERALAAYWHHERRGFKRPKPRLSQPRTVNQKRIDRAKEIRKQVFATLSIGVGSAIAIAKAVGVHESTARAHLRALREEGLATFTKEKNVTTWKAVK